MATNLKCTVKHTHTPNHANGPYAKLFKIINFKGAEGPMFN